MNDEFNQLSQAVMEYISNLSRGKETKRFYARCFDKLGNHLLEKEADYSVEEASNWLESVNGQVGQTEFGLFKAAVNKLNDLYLYGEIHTVHYDQAKTIVGKLCTEFQTVLNRLVIRISEKAADTVSGHSYGCANILLRFQNSGIFSASGITYKALLVEFFSSAEKSHYTKASHHENLRLLLQFLYEENLVPYGYNLFVDGMTMRKGYFWNHVSPEALTGLEEPGHDEEALSLEDFLLLQNSLYQEHFHASYSRTSLTGLRRITNMFYLFMDMNHLRYSPPVGDIWLNSMKQYISSLEYRHFRRILCLLEQRFNDSPFPLESSFVFKRTVYDDLPGWCLPEVNSFLALKEGEGGAVSTISMYRISICRFCIGINSMGIASFKVLTPLAVKQFNLVDQHRTPEGKNAYNSRIRKFLQYLGENGSLANPFLFLALPCVCAAKDSLVITLTEEEQESLRNIFQAEDTTISLGKKAMLQLGLYMGLRGIDIINLTIDDIDWENASVRIRQNKTDYEIVLPMPTVVANAIYRYIICERPVSDTRNIFVRKVAPFSPLGRGACRRALNKALLERDVPGSGFHVTRKTFATNLLRNDVPPQHVAEALGHQGLTAIHKYLSLEESRMRLCGLSLADRNLAPTGGFCHE